MSDAIIWKVDRLVRAPSNGLVTRVIWSCRAGSGRPFPSHTDLMGNPDDPHFTPFEDLAEAQVLEWVHQSLGNNKSEIEAGAVRRANLDNDVAPTLPWEGTP